MKPKLALIQDYHPNFYDTYKELEKHYDLTMYGVSYYDIPKDINNFEWKTSQSGRFYFANPFKLYKLVKGHKQAIIKDFSQPKSLIAIIICTILGIKHSIMIQKMEWFNRHPLVLKILVKLIIGKDTPIIARVREGYDNAKQFFDNVTYIPFAITKKEKVPYTKGANVNVLCVGKLTDENKNQIQLIEALEDIDNDFELTLVGSLKEKSNHYYKIQKTMLSSMNKIFILTNLNKKDMELEYAMTDLYILPTLREPANYSVLEAMSHGLPVISSSGNGSSCYIDKDYVFNSGDKESLAKVINNSLSNLEFMGYRNYKLVEKNHKPKNIVKKIIEVIEK